MYSTFRFYFPNFLTFQKRLTQLWKPSYKDAISVVDEALTIIMKNGGEGTLDPEKVIQRLADQKSTNCAICLGDINIFLTGSSYQDILSRDLMRGAGKDQKDTLPDNFLVISTHEGPVSTKILFYFIKNQLFEIPNFCFKLY